MLINIIIIIIILCVYLYFSTVINIYYLVN